MSIILGIVGAIWGLTRDLALRPDVEVGIGIFLVVLWTYIGLSTVTRRNKAQLVKAEQDFAYGLTFAGIAPNYQPANPAATLQFGIAFQNYGGGPVKYEIEEFEIVIGNRTLPKKKWTAPASVMARGATRLSRKEPFTADDVKDLIGKELKGSLSFSVVYGHPDKAPIRRLTMTFDIFVTLTQAIDPFLGLVGQIAYGDSIVEERDELITPN